jgi:hypothetical protein
MLSCLHAIKLRFTAGERKTIDATIVKSGLSQSKWARKVLLSAADCGSVSA